MATLAEQEHALQTQVDTKLAEATRFGNSSVAMELLLSDIKNAEILLNTLTTERDTLRSRPRIELLIPARLDSSGLYSFTIFRRMCNLSDWGKCCVGFVAVSFVTVSLLAYAWYLSKRKIWLCGLGFVILLIVARVVYLVKISSSNFPSLIDYTFVGFVAVSLLAYAWYSSKRKIGRLGNLCFLLGLLFLLIVGDILYFGVYDQLPGAGRRNIGRVVLALHDLFMSPLYRSCLTIDCSPGWSEPNCSIQVSPFDLQVFTSTQKQLLTSRRVLTAALRDPEVAKLPIIKQQSDPIAWLQKNLSVGGEYSCVEMSITSQDSKDLFVPLLNAVAIAYVKEVIDSVDVVEICESELMETCMNMYKHEPNKQMLVYINRPRISIRGVTINRIPHSAFEKWCSKVFLSADEFPDHNVSSPGDICQKLKELQEIYRRQHQRKLLPLPNRTDRFRIDSLSGHPANSHIQVASTYATAILISKRT